MPWPRRRLGAVALLCALALAPDRALAQGLDTAERQQRAAREEQERLRGLRELRESRPAPVTLERPEPSAAEAAISIPVSRVAVEGGSSLDPAEVRAVVAPIEGRTVTYRQLLDVVEALNELYRRRGLVGVAFLPPQRIVGGVVTIALMDSRLGRVVVEGARSTDPAFARGFIRLEPGGVVSITALSRDVERLRAATDLGAAIDLKPGEGSGEVDARLTLIEPPRPFVASAGVDNLGAYATGRLRTLGSLFAPSLTGRRDALALDVLASRGSRVGALSYDTPLGVWGTRLRLEGSVSQSQIIDGVARQLDVQGESRFGRATLSQVLVAEPGFRLIGAGAVLARRGSTALSDLKVGRESYAAVSPGLDMIAAFGPVAAFVRASAMFGTNDAAPARSFRKATIEGLLSVSLPAEATLLVRAAAQYAPPRDPLPSSERFALGGFFRLRGYPVDYFTGAQGAYVSAEIGRPFVLPVAGGLQVRPFAMVEYGGVKDTIVNPLRGRFGASAGAGLDIQLEPGTLRLSVATPLMKTAREQDRPGTAFHVSFTVANF